MVAELIAFAVAVFAGIAESLHAMRVRRLARLAFGPVERPRAWAVWAPALRVAALTLMAWGLATLLSTEPRIYLAEEVKPGEEKHLLILLDVSPSMRLSDAGPEKEQPRRLRARDIIESFYSRVSTAKYRTSVLAFYNGAKPVVIDTKDTGVVYSIMGELPLYQAFESGKTQLFDGLEEAAKIAKPWNPKSTILIVLTDGDTVPATGMPRMPAAIGGVLVVGVGDKRKGTFIDGRQSRQDASTLRQVAARLNGIYHDGNEHHITSSTLRSLLEGSGGAKVDQWGRREYALVAAGIGGFLYALLPILLQLFGTGWHPGFPVNRRPKNVELESQGEHTPRKVSGELVDAIS